MYNQNRADQAPFRQAGLTGLNQYLAMLGLPSTSSSDYGSTGQPTSWSTVTNGVPTYNSDLYATDPAYKAAWDQTAQEHQNQFGVGYNADSSDSAINARVQQLYQQNGGGNTAST